MDGVFCKQGITKVYNIIGLISGVFLVLLFGSFICVGEFGALDDMIASWFFVCFGFLDTIFCSVSLYLNQKAYIYVDDQRISAFCHFGLSLECDLSDVSSVSYGGTGLNIQLKNGKKYNLMNLENAYQIGKHIQKKISVKPTAFLDKDQLMVAILKLRKKRKQEGIWSIICFLLIFPIILLTVALTGWKALHEFCSNDWIVFSIMLGVGVIMFVVFGILLHKYSSNTDKLNKMQGMLYQTILQTTPVQPGNAIKLFIDDDVYASIRLTIYGYPNSDEVYFTIEQVNQRYEIECIHTSQVYSNIDELTSEVKDMTEIALP